MSAEEVEEHGRIPDPDDFVPPVPPPSYFATFYSCTPRLNRRYHSFLSPLGSPCYIPHSDLLVSGMPSLSSTSSPKSRQIVLAGCSLPFCFSLISQVTPKISPTLTQRYTFSISISFLGKMDTQGDNSCNLT